jgi:ribosomal protein S4E
LRGWLRLALHPHIEGVRAMNRVKMLKTQLGTHDGYTPVTFKAGKEYEVSDDLLLAFIDIGCAELVFENKAVEAMPNRKVRKARK